MQKWEYLSLTATRADDGVFRVRYQNGKEVDNWQNGPILVDYLNQLGDEGWELVTETALNGENWEYSLLEIPANFKELKFKDAKYVGFDNIMKYINQLGTRGWELVGMEGVIASGGGVGSYTNLYTAVFKRSLGERCYRFRLKRPKS